MCRQSKLFQRTYMILLMSFSASSAIAGSVASEQADTGGLTLSPTVSYDSASLHVSSDNLDTTSSFSSGESIRVDAGGLADGVYYYELSLSNNPSENAPNGSSVTQNGDFKVSQGVASSNSDEEQEAEAQAEAAAVAATQTYEGEPK